MECSLQSKSRSKPLGRSPFLYVTNARPFFLRSWRRLSPKSPLTDCARGKPSHCSTQEAQEEARKCIVRKEELSSETPRHNPKLRGISDHSGGSVEQCTRSRHERFPETINRTARPSGKTSRSGKAKSSKNGRFGGMSEAAVLRMTLRDVLSHNLNVLVVGINPGVMSAFRGHHYAGPGNHFWPCMIGSGLVPEGFTYRHDIECLQHGIGELRVIATWNCEESIVQRRRAVLLD